MTPAIIACLIALSLALHLFIFIKLRQILSFHENAFQEFQIIKGQIPLIDTWAEYEFWQNESLRFISVYRKRVDPRLLSLYEAAFDSAFRLRQYKGIKYK